MRLIVRRVPVVLVSVALLINLLVVSCRNPVGEVESPGTAPEIGRVNFYYYDTDDDAFYLTYDFHVGETAYVEIAALDPDLDMRRLSTTTTHRDVGIVTRDDAIMDSQTGERIWYYREIEIIGPVGDAEISFTVTDAAGNRSRDYTKTVTIF